ncbi:MAG: hypothetical protein QOG71_2238 [Pyrinomonadaceae bacterium]|nr:hypothetical protein [Pyrinomonadaceae bacterium]
MYLFILLIYFAIIIGGMIYAHGLWDKVEARSVRPNQPDKKNSIVASATLNRLLKLITSSSDEQENIIGDLLEEFNEYPSRLPAHFWLYKQVLKSVLPLIYKTARNRLASYFGERVR